MSIASFPGSREVTIIKNPGADAEKRSKAIGNIQKAKGYFDVDAPVDTGDAVEFTDARGKLLRHTVGEVFATGEGTDLAHIEVTWARTDPVAAPRTVINNTFAQPVGSLQIGDHNVSNVVMPSQQGLEDFLRQLEGLRTEVTTLAPAVRTDALEQVEDLSTEVRGAKKPSKIKAALGALTEVATGSVDLATKVAALVELARKVGLMK